MSGPDIGDPFTKPKKGPKSRVAEKPYVEPFEVHPNASSRVGKPCRLSIP